MEDSAMNTVAIIGASNDRAKFGNKAVRAFCQQEYTVYPVNPKETAIEGLPAVNNFFVRRVERVASRGMFEPVTGKRLALKTRVRRAVEQPPPFTPGVTKGMVRQHAFELFRDKLPDHPLTLQDWVLAEKDLVNSLETDGLLKR